MSPNVTTRRRPARAAALALVLALALPVLSGCLRAEVTMAVTAQDEVTGVMVLAVPQGGTPPELVVPPALEGAVTVEDYTEGEYTGSRVLFEELTFAQVELLASLTTTGQGQYELSFRRAGDVVSLEGRVDLTDVTADRSNIVLTIAFPSAVTTTNGVRDGDSSVTWSVADGPLQLGRETLVQATVRYPDPSSRSFTQWSLLLGGVVGGVAVLVGLLAGLARDRTPRPGRVPR